VKENAWVVVVEGTLEIGAGAESVELGPGGLVRFEPGERHTLASPGGARVLLVLTPWPGAGHYDGGS
jgi:mannose-6-phosphate isomerase-like protein (cupin superfamily)